MEPDWTDGELRHRLEVVQVYPAQLDKTVPGEIDVVSSGASITTGYYTDARASAKVTVSDPSQLADNSWIRLVHKVDGTDYSRELGTFVVADVTPKTKAGQTQYDLDLRSVLWAMSKDISGGGFTIGKGGTLSAALRTQMGWAGFEYTTSGMVDYRWKSVLALETCKDRLSWLYATVEPTENRIDVDGHGRVTVGRYIAPQYRTASRLIDCDDPRSVVVDGSVEWSGDNVGRVNKAVVKATRSSGGAWYGEAYAPQSAKWSRQSRGWIAAELHTVSDMSAPYTYAHAGQMAQQYLEKDSAANGSWTVTTAWLPLQAGDIVEFAPRRYDPWGDGTARKCLVKSCDADCGKWRLKMTLKEV